MKVPNLWGLSAICLGLLLPLSGCNKSEDSVESEIPTIAFPASPTAPSELVALWEIKNKTVKMDFQADGKCALESKIMSYSGSGETGKTVAGGGTRTTNGKWGVEGDQLFLALDGQPVIKYRFEVKTENLELYSGKIKTSYTKIPKK